MCPLGMLCCVCGVPVHLAPVHRCTRSVCSAASAVSWATWLLFTGLRARCAVLRVRCPGQGGCCSPVCLLGSLCCGCGVLGHLASAHRCARSVRCVVCAVSWATWLLFTGVHARRVVLRVGRPGALGSCSPCARSACCVASAVSWATWLLFTGVYVRGVVLRLRCPGPLGSCTPLCSLSVLCSVCGVLGHLAPVHQCVQSLCCVACTVCWATWLLFTGVLPWRVVLGARYPQQLSSCPSVCLLGVLRFASHARCPGPLGSCSPVCALGVLSFVCGWLLRGAQLSIWMAAFPSRQALSPVRTRTRPSGRRLFRSRQKLGMLLGAHSSIQTAAVP